MKGFAMLRVGQVGWINAERPKLGPFDAIVRPLAVAPSTEDVHMAFKGVIGEQGPVILGHEAVGKVMEVGEAVKSVKPGNRVVAPSVILNWHIPLAQPEEPGQGGPRIKHGVFSEFFHVNDADGNLAVLPEDMTLEQGILMSDVMSTGLYGAELADIRMGATVAVVGLNALGLMSVAGAKLRGAGRLIAISSQRKYLDLAREYGATDVIHYHQDEDEGFAGQVLRLTRNQGVNHVIIGEGDDMLGQALKFLKPGGTISNIGSLVRDANVSKSAKEGDAQAHKVLRGGLPPGGRERMERMIDLIRYKRVDPLKLISHVFKGLESVEEAVMLLKNTPANVVKAIVVMD
jgi:threonine dehydrogenase-like Zn-dependent dehydrogenase